YGRLRISRGLLNIALQLLGGAFRLQFVGPDHVTNALLCLTGRLIRKTTCLVCRAAHRDDSQTLLNLWLSTSGATGRSTLEGSTAAIEDSPCSLSDDRCSPVKTVVDNRLSP